jgi:hypothetical protein
VPFVCSGRTANNDNCDLDHCRSGGNCHNLGRGDDLYDKGGQMKSPGMDSRTYSHVKEARTQKETSSGNCAEIEKDRGGDATEGF